MNREYTTLINKSVLLLHAGSRSSRTYIIVIIIVVLIVISPTITITTATKAAVDGPCTVPRRVEHAPSQDLQYKNLLDTRT